MVDAIRHSPEQTSVIIPDILDVLQPPEGMYADLADPQPDQRTTAQIYANAVWTYQFLHHGELIYYAERETPLDPTVVIVDNGKTRPTVNFVNAEALTGYFGKISGAKDWLERMRTLTVENLPDDWNDLWLPPNTDLAKYFFTHGGKLHYTFFDGVHYHDMLYENQKRVLAFSDV